LTLQLHDVTWAFPKFNKDEKLSIKTRPVYLSRLLMKKVFLKVGFTPQPLGGTYLETTFVINCSTELNHFLVF